MTAHVYTATTTGFTGKLIDVECDTSNGLPSLSIVGLGNKSIDEAKERVRSAIKNTHLDFLRKRIIVNLAPANIPKDGTHFDLPIAIALLCASKQLSQSNLTSTLFVGELALDGSLRPIRGIINYAEAAANAKLQNIIVPLENCEQAALVPGIQVMGAKNLREVFLHLTGEATLSIFKNLASAPEQPTRNGMELIHGQEQAKRALVVAAAGHHNILFKGPPGAGKTMLAKSLVSVLPDLSKGEVIEVTKLYSLAGEITRGTMKARPFRSPHHTASVTSLVGGGNHPKPGEISLAHRGVLFLDELPEYSRNALEALRQPLEDKIVHITRTHSTATYPADFMLVATMNPCPCGYLNDDSQECSCSLSQISNYKKRLSGPLLDRIDMVIEVGKVRHEKLLSELAPPAPDPRRLIVQAREVQRKRFLGADRTNSSLANAEVRTSANLSAAAKTLLDTAAAKLNISARSYFKLIKVSRTIADLESSEYIMPGHISEALQYRQR